MYTWDLKPLYKGFNDKDFINDRKLIFEKVDAIINLYVDDKIIKNQSLFLETVLKEQEKLNILVSKVIGFISLTRSTDTGNIEANQALVSIQPLMGKFALIDSRLKQYLKNIENLNDVINRSDFLKQYSFLINETKKKIMFTMPEELEVLSSEMTQNGASLWGQMQSYLTSNAEVIFRGESKSLSEIRNLAYDNDATIRKEAFYKEQEIYKSIEDPISFAISGIKGEVNILHKRRGYETVIDEALFKSRMTQETLNALLEAMKDSLPHFQKYLLHKSKLLGHEKGLPWYDLFAPIGVSENRYTIEEAQEFILEQFKTFGDDLFAMANRAFTEQWVDYLPRKGKVGGAFCSNNYAIKQSRVLTNFGGVIGDIITLAHELGHAYHGEQIFKEAPLNSFYTMPVAETASTLCETIVKRAAYNKAKTKEEKVYLLEQELQDSTQVIVDIYSRFVFEESVFAARKKSIPNPKILNELMLTAQKTAYGSALNWEYLNPGMWINKSHYYSAGLSYYNFPYAFGLLFAKGLYANYLKQGSIYVEKINELLRLTGQMGVEDVALTVGINIKEKSFWEAGLKVIFDDIDTFIKITS